MNEFWTVFAAFLAALTLVGGAFAVGRRHGYKQAMRHLNNSREATRFSEIYAPLMGLFTTCHITTVTGRGAPYLRQRIRNAAELLCEGKLTRAWRAVFDKQDLGISGEVEYGSAFPLAGITRHIRGREQFADQLLIHLVSRANRSHYEDQPEENELTESDLMLFQHVCQEHQSLSLRFISA